MQIVGIDKHGSPLLVGDKVKLMTTRGWYVWGTILQIKNGLAKVDFYQASPGSPASIIPEILEISCDKLEKRNNELFPPDAQDHPQ